MTTEQRHPDRGTWHLWYKRRRKANGDGEGLKKSDRRDRDGELVSFCYAVLMTSYNKGAGVQQGMLSWLSTQLAEHAAG